MEGLDLSPVLRGEPLDLASRAIYCESYVPTKVGCNPIFALVGPRWKYIATTRPELYDISEDPWEERNLVDAEPVRARELDDRLQARLESSRPGEALAPDEETRAQLAALGYLTGPIDATPAIDPTRPDPKDRLRAWDVLRRGDPQDARFEERDQRLKEVARDFPDLVDVHRQLGAVAQAEHDWRRSIVHYELYQRLLEAGPGGGDPRLRADARNRIGMARVEMGQRDRALEDFEEAVRIDPSATHPLRNAAIALVRLGRVDDAVDKLTELLALDPDDQEIRGFRERLLAGDTSQFE